VRDRRRCSPRGPHGVPGRWTPPVEVGDRRGEAGLDPRRHRRRSHRSGRASLPSTTTGCTVRSTVPWRGSAATDYGRMPALRSWATSSPGPPPGAPWRFWWAIPRCPHLHARGQRSAGGRRRPSDDVYSPALPPSQAPPCAESSRWSTARGAPTADARGRSLARRPAGPLPPTSLGLRALVLPVDGGVHVRDHSKSVARPSGRLHAARRGHPGDGALVPGTGRQVAGSQKVIAREPRCDPKLEARSPARPAG